MWNTYPVWLRDQVDRSLPFGLTLPVTWFQALDSLTVLLFAPLVMLLWRRQARRAAEPSDLAKIALGCGWLVRFYEPAGPAVFWLIHMVVAALGTLSILVLRGMFVRVLELNEKP